MKSMEMCMRSGSRGIVRLCPHLLLDKNAKAPLFSVYTPALALYNGREIYCIGVPPCKTNPPALSSR